MAGRRAALTDLAAQMPAAVLADLLHLAPTTAARWMHQAGGDWTGYAAEIARIAQSPAMTKTSPAMFRTDLFSTTAKPLTTSLEGGTPVEQIAGILGHQSVQSTGVYLKSSLGLLARCALDPDAPAREVSR
jgi:hypothetical protein